MEDWNTRETVALITASREAGHLTESQAEELRQLVDVGSVPVVVDVLHGLLRG